MEYAMCNELVKICRQKNIDVIYGYYFETKKNAMVADLYLKFGFEQLSETKFKLNINEYVNKEVYV
jgi:predicted enzyme involved in methoxymalonyl-ACP biosynthesis